MRLLTLIAWAGIALRTSSAVAIPAASEASSSSSSSSVLSTAGVEALVRRRLPRHAHVFEFALVKGWQPAPLGNASQPESYVVSSTKNGKIHVQGDTLSAILSG